MSSLVKSLCREETKLEVIMGMAKVCPAEELGVGEGLEPALKDLPSLC